MKKSVLTSTNRVKLEATKDAVAALIPGVDFEFISIDVEDSGSEPVGEKAVCDQIIKAIKKARDADHDATYYVGMEGGVRETDHGMEEVAYVIIEDVESRRSYSQSVSFPVPPNVADKVRKGISFAEAVDEVHSTKNIKTGQGFIGLLTNGIVDKKALYFQPLAVAFSRLLKGEWYD